MPYRRRYRSSKFSIFNFQFSILILLLLAGIGFFYLWHTGKFGRFDRFNLVISGPLVTFVSLDVHNKTATVVSFPEDFYVTSVVPNYGSYRMASVYRVGELDHQGGQVLVWTVSDFLGVPVDGFLISNSKLTDVKKFFLRPGIFLGDKTNLNFLDLARFVVNLETVRFDRINFRDLATVATPLVLADGSSARTIDKEQVDSFLAGDFVEQKARDEGLRLEVTNSTPALGLGGRAARVLGNLGLSVVSVSSTSQSQAGCLVKATSKNLATLTTLRAAETFSCKIETMADSGRADVVLILGQDYAQKFLK